MERQEIINLIREKKVIAIVRGIPEKKCGPLAKALYKGGIRLMEITFDQSAENGYEETLQGIREAIKETGSSMCVGAGTVMTAEQVLLAESAGAGFLISPHTDAGLIRMTTEQGMVSIPGALTPTEAVRAWRAGASFVKIFPAQNLGSGYIKALTGPLKQIPFLAVGGISEDNAREFLQAGACGVGIGGRLVNREWIMADEFEKITELAGRISEGLSGERKEREW